MQKYILTLFAIVFYACVSLSATEMVSAAGKEAEFCPILYKFDRQQNPSLPDCIEQAREFSIAYMSKEDSRIAAGLKKPTGSPEADWALKAIEPAGGYEFYIAKSNGDPTQDKCRSLLRNVKAEIKNLYLDPYELYDAKSPNSSMNLMQNSHYECMELYKAGKLKAPKHSENSGASSKKSYPFKRDQGVSAPSKKSQ